ncbi:MAG: hypothetical protein R3217_08785 [Gammaproteobacteria bacterium]|nr:hypothetical protein [Gammaproteobacteria bacterium]
MNEWLMGHWYLLPLIAFIACHLCMIVAVQVVSIKHASRRLLFWLFISASAASSYCAFLIIYFWPTLGRMDSDGERLLTIGLMLTLGITALIIAFSDTESMRKEARNFTDGNKAHILRNRDAEYSPADRVRDSKLADPADRQ